MKDLFIYILQVNLLLSFIYLGYYFLLHKLTFHTLNRVYFLTGLAYALLYPFLNLNIFTSVKTPIPFSNSLSYDAILPINTTAQSGITLLHMVLFIIASGTVIYLLRLLVRLLGVYHIHRKSYKTNWKKFRYREVAFPILPFSFLKSIYLNKEQHSSKELYSIFKHESLHVKGLHSVDTLLFEIVLVACWYNPFVWLMRKAIRQNLEFLTDQQVLESGMDRQAYQLALVGVAKDAYNHPLGNTFSFKPLKNRIMMMNKKASSKLQLGKYLLLIPTFIFLGAGLTVSKAESKIESLSQKAFDTKWETEIPSLHSQDTIKEVNPKIIIQKKDLSNDEIKNIDPKNIKSIEVLKGKKAVEKYGDSASNGIIEISLKNKKELSDISVTKEAKSEIKNILYILDGEIISKEKMVSISPNQIKSVDVIKDPEKTAEYGEAGKNGVIHITLK